MKKSLVVIQRETFRNYTPINTVGIGFDVYLEYNSSPANLVLKDPGETGLLFLLEVSISVNTSG